MDIVYVNKHAEYNPDLMYSLRLLDANVTGYDRIWITGYKPSWVNTKVNLIPIIQDAGSKWLNARKNLYYACRHKKVSDDFFLFHDDFFAINKVNLETDLKAPRRHGTLLQMAKKFTAEEMAADYWKSIFPNTIDALKRLGSKHFDNFEVHMPVIYNKHKWLEMWDTPEIRSIIESYPSIAPRSLYLNLNWHKPVQTKDYKIPFEKDLPEGWENTQWISVYDDVTNNLDQYPRLKAILEPYPKSKFERKPRR